MALDLTRLAEWRRELGDGTAWLFIFALSIADIDPADPTGEWLRTNYGRPWNDTVAAGVLDCSAATFARWRRAMTKAGYIRVEHLRRGSRAYTLRLRNLAFILAENTAPVVEQQAATGAALGGAKFLN